MLKCLRSIVCGSPSWRGPNRNAKPEFTRRRLCRSCLPLWLAIVVGLLPQPLVSGGDSADGDRLQALIDRLWEFEMRESPLRATAVGDHRFKDQLDMVSVSDARRRAQVRAAALKELQAISRDELSPQQRINARILERILADQLAEHRFRAYLIPITNREGFYIDFPELRRQVPLHDAQDYEAYIVRLRGYLKYTRQHIVLMREGLKAGMTLPSVVLEGYRKPIETHIVDDPRQSLMFEPLQKFPVNISAADRARLTGAAEEAIRESFIPAYRELLQFMSTEYVPQARGSIAAAALPEGRAFYRHRVRMFTTLDLLPEQVHQLGQQEVARIRDEMLKVIERVGFEGDFGEFVTFLRTDPRFYVDTPAQLMKEVALIAKRIDGKLPQLFGTLPRTPYGLREIPAYIAPNTTTAYYMPPPGDRSDAGYYYVNTYNLKSRPRYELEALSLHEAVPGHHLQIALAQELERVPDFRRFAGFTAFVEGWALYAERLGLEVGFYEDPYSDFGRLTYEMWRACRLVVDTGIHYLGWTRTQAVDFVAANSALSLHNIRAEVDRYIAWPGQALGYKVGELKIRELRAMAEDKLGESFDVREFHDVVLGNGAVPLDLLESIVTDYVETKAARAPATP